jgi:hypothetical protein
MVSGVPDQLPRSRTHAVGSWRRGRPRHDLPLLVSSFNRQAKCKCFFVLSANSVCRVQGRLRGRHGPPPHGGASRRGLPMWTTHYSDPAVHPNKRNGSAHVPAGTSRRVQRLNAIGSLPQATTAPAVRSNTSPDFSIACIITASLRATATAARLKPNRSLSLRPHVHSALSADERVKITVAASSRRPRR